MGFDTRNPLRQEGFPLSTYFSPAAAGSFNPLRQQGLDRFGDLETYALCQLIALAFRDIERYAGKAWFEHPYSYGHAKTALTELFRYFQPLDIISDAETELRAPHPLLKEFGTDAARATMQGLDLGRVVAHSSVLHLEASIERDNLLDSERLKAIAAALLPRLVAAGMSGEAARELKQIDDSRKRSA